MIYVGTSGWQYDDWRGRFYPKNLPKTQWLAHFSREFPTVEVNNTFYRLPGEDTFVRWRQESAQGFVVTVKASRFITHIRRLSDCRDPLRLLSLRCRRLGTKLGPILFQLPPRFEVDTGRLEAFCGVMPKGIRPAFEFRDRSWERDDVFQILDAHGAAFVWADSPGTRVRDVVTGGWSYIRFHKGTRVKPGYTGEKLRRWARRLAALEASDVYVYFNNDTGGAAIRDANRLTGLLKELTPTAVYPQSRSR